MVRVINCCRSVRAAVLVVLLAPLLVAPAYVFAAAAKKRPGTASQSSDNVIDDMAAVATVRPRKCIDAKQTGSPIGGWRADEPRCAWQNHLEMRRWEAEADSTRPHCVSRQATWWGLKLAGETHEEDGHD